MSSYIKFMFKYLFQWSSGDQQLDEAGELEARGQQLNSNSSNSSPSTASQLAASLAGSLAPDKSSRCLSLARALLAENKTASALRSFSEFEQLARNSSSLLTRHQHHHHQYRNHPMQQTTSSGGNSQQQPASQLELLECYNQLQLQDYYSGYDIFIGMRIASTLTILFVVFILFVIYKTGCHEGQASRSQFSTTSGAAKVYAKNGKASAGAAGRRRQQRRRYQQQQQKLQLAEPAMLSRQVSASRDAPSPSRPAACNKPPEAPPMPT